MEDTEDSCEYKGKQYVAAPTISREDACIGCVGHYDDTACIAMPTCYVSQRQDKRNVIFVSNIPDTLKDTEDKFTLEGIVYIAVEQDGCRNCDFTTIKNSSGCKLEFINDVMPHCSGTHRKDNRHVIFVRSDIDNLGDKE